MNTGPDSDKATMMLPAAAVRGAFLKELLRLQVGRLVLQHRERWQAEALARPRRAVVTSVFAAC